MIKSRTTQLIYQTAYCAFGIIAVIGSLGIFDDVSNIRWDFYTHFTNLSNIFCLAIMFTALVQTARKKEDGYVSALSMLKFMGLLAILMTFVIFNVFLAGEEGRDPQLNWRVGSLLLHVVLPIMYIADWFLFYERGKAKWYYVFAAIGFPALYAVFIYTQAAILGFDTSILTPTGASLIYPYFFLNLDKVGVTGVAKWFSVLFAAHIVVGYGFFGLDRLFKKRNKAIAPKDN